MKSFEIKLVLPTKEHRGQVEEYKRKFANEKMVSTNLMPGCSSLEKKSVDEWLAECDAHRVGKNLPEICSGDSVSWRAEVGQQTCWDVPNSA